MFGIRVRRVCNVLYVYLQRIALRTSQHGIDSQTMERCDEGIGLHRSWVHLLFVVYDLTVC